MAIIYLIKHNYYPCFINTQKHGISLAVQWLRLCTFSAGATGSIPGRGTKTPHAMQQSQIFFKKEAET